MNGNYGFDSDNRVIYTVSELNQNVSSLLRASLPALWISGELSNVAYPSSGHWYFSLKDAQACVRCVMFQDQNKLLNFQPQNGHQVLLYAKIGLYQRRGEFQLIVEHIEAAGDGALRLAFEALKTRLAAEGLFDAQYKKTLPTLPKTIGLVTSPTGAVILDILSILHKRSPMVSVVVYPTVVQGTCAAEQIAAMLTIANQRDECDVLILARGGGSLEDLWPFNEEIVARAIYASAIPVISAVGHEVDFTIADFVADLRAATPSAAAVLVSPNQQEWQQRLIGYLNRLHSRCSTCLNDYQHTLNNLTARLRHPGQRLQDYWQYIDRLEKSLVRAIGVQLQQKQQRLANLLRALDMINPLAILARGYALVTCPDGRLVYTADQIDEGAEIIVRLAQAKLSCTVNKKQRICDKTTMG